MNKKIQGVNMVNACDWMDDFAEIKEYIDALTEICEPGPTFHILYDIQKKIDGFDKTHCLPFQERLK